MAEANITIPADAMREVVAKAILDSLTGDQKEALIASALNYLTTSPPNNRGFGAPDQPSPLQVAFNTAVREAAVEVVKEVVHDELAVRVREVVLQKVADAVTADSILASGIGYAVGEVVSTALREGTR